MEKYYVPRYKNASGRPCRFADRDDLLVAIPADKMLEKEFITKRHADQAVQAVTQKSVSHVNTENKVYVGKGVNHKEGGWPKDLNRVDEEQTQRYRKKIEKSEAFASQINSLLKVTEHAIMQNNAVNIYEDYFEELHPIELTGKSSAKTIGMYRDYSELRRSCTRISWADGSDFFVCSYMASQSSTGFVNDAYIWDTEYQNKPVFVLKAPQPAPCVEFNPKDIHILASGLFSGQIAVWDSRVGNDPIKITERETSHRDRVNTLLWSSTKTSSEFFTGSAEGEILWWDLRKLDVPTDELLLDPMQTNKQDYVRSFGISALEFADSMPTKFMAGSEHGMLFTCNKKGKTATEKIMSKVQCHYGPIYSLERNSSFLKNYLTVGDWQAKIWSDECKESAIVWSKSQRQHLSSGCWSPTRCSVFFLTRMDGCFEIWDLLQQFNDKVVMMKISDFPILCSRAHKSGRLVTLGTSCGDIYQVEVSANLTHSGSNDRSSFLAMLERETKRERLLESKHREIKLKEKESERVRLLEEEGATENAIAEEVLIQHAETAFMQWISGDEEKVKTPVSYLDADNDEKLMEARNSRSQKFKF